MCFVCALLFLLLFCVCFVCDLCITSLCQAVCFFSISYTVKIFFLCSNGQPKSNLWGNSFPGSSTNCAAPLLAPSPTHSTSSVSSTHSTRPYPSTDSVPLWSGNDPTYPVFTFIRRVENAVLNFTFTDAEKFSFLRACMSSDTGRRPGLRYRTIFTLQAHISNPFVTNLSRSLPLLILILVWHPSPI